MGCHRSRISDRIVFDKLLQVLRFGCSYQGIADTTCSATTIRTRRDEWIKAGVFAELKQIALASYDRIVGLLLDDIAVDGCITKAPGGGECAGPSPVDRRKQGLKRSLLVEGYGIPLGGVLAGGNRHDSPLLEPTLGRLDKLGPLPDEVTVYLDSGYDSGKTRATLAEHGLAGEIAHKGDTAPIQASKRWRTPINSASSTSSSRRLLSSASSSPWRLCSGLLYSRSVGELLVGTASWTDRSLIESGWYPPEVNTAAKRLAYYAGIFPLVEVDATYYHPPAENTARLWAQRTPTGFTFNIKAFSLFTQHPTRVDALPKDLRPNSDRQRIYAHHLNGHVVDEMWDRFLSAINPLREADKLGAVLLQFPHWFPISRSNKRYLLDCRDRCSPIPVCVEFRNHTWMSEDNREETLEFLAAHELPYVCVDMPQGYTSSVPPVVAATADLAVLRFHGHSDQWTSGNVQERFHYRYSQDELASWASRINELAEQASTTHVLMNNCHGDDAQANAQQLAALLDVAEPRA